MTERITETITFHFDDVDQQKRFHERLKSAPTGQAEPVADEWAEGAKLTMLQLRLHLRSMIKYARWTINEGPGHHPTLPSAIASAQMTLDDAERFYATSPTPPTGQAEPVAAPPDGYMVVPDGLIDLVDTLLMQAVAGPSPAWMIIPRTEYEQATERIRAMLAASPTREGT